MRSRSIAVLPNAGLGNILFPWAHAQVFGVLNGIPACAVGWSRPHIGPLLRGDRMRFYANSFKQSVSELAASGLLCLRATIVRNPPLQSIGEDLKNDHLFVWDQLPHWSDYFGSIRDFRDVVKRRIWEAVNHRVRLEVMAIASPNIAVHIRCGDFRPLRAGEEFGRVGGSIRTPLTHFITIIQEIRRCCGRDIPVTVFSDGHSSELHSVLGLPEVRLARTNKAIVDLLLISRAQLIVTSASSTFGYWAGFLADSPVILHPDHVHAPHRPVLINSKYFEGRALGPFESWPDLLIANIKEFAR